MGGMRDKPRKDSRKLPGEGNISDGGAGNTYNPVKDKEQQDFAGGSVGTGSSTSSIGVGSDANQNVSYGANVAYERDMFGQVDYGKTRNKYQGSRTENYNYHWEQGGSGDKGRDRSGVRTGTRKSQAGVNQEAIDATQAADAGYAARQEALLSNNGSTSNVSTVQTGEDLNIGASTAKDVGGSAGKRRRNVKGAMSATLGIS